MSALSPPLHIERIYRSMEGPAASTTFTLKQGPPALLWITAYRTEVVDADGQPISQEFMCHNNMDFDRKWHRHFFGWKKEMGFGRMFTTSQGQFEVDLPEGFGIPVLSNEPFRLDTQVLNHNREQVDVEVRHRISIEYLRDEDAAGRLEPLFPTYAYVMVLVEGEGGVYQVEHPSHQQQGAACLPGELAPQASLDNLLVDGPGRTFTGHWVVPPGREERRTLVNHFLRIPFDTTIHHIGVHLHPFAESLELRDLTSGETVYKAGARGLEQGTGLAQVDLYSSAEGLPVYADHDYEMVSVYDNTTGVEQDAMAVFFVYLHDREAGPGLDAIRQQLRQAGAAPGGS